MCIRKGSILTCTCCNTFVFLGMAGREMATGKGHGVMETGRRVGGWGRGKRWGWGDRGWQGTDMERAKVGWLMLFTDI